ncbi:phage tail fiber protein [Xenorhabdus sp. KK7.4]|uniref:phage tail fiber protein n=1 Tax=Xenorhabdus sp. KK7.4 TaxID=1851572 RepID=UPI000C060775|nr:phage tail protein [Xenorhabdus sp. KK7.4]PHM55043.1 tail protein [Xenorhabdus sp. KK7.4]
MQDKKPDAPVSEDSNLVIVTTPEYVKDSIKEAIAEHAASRNHPYATQAEPGFVTLSNAVDNDSEITVATSKAVKKAYDLANTANQNALNNNSDLYLEKKQNGADIPDKTLFVKNIGLSETVKLAKDAYSPNNKPSAHDIGSIQTNANLIVGSSNNSNIGDFKDIPTNSTYFNYHGAVDGINVYGTGIKICGPLGGYDFVLQSNYDEKNGGLYYRVRNGDRGCWLPFRKILDEGSVRLDEKGYLRQISSIIQINSDGTFITKGESKGATAERISEGIYLIKGVSGFSTDDIQSDTDNDIEIPLSKNKLPLIWINHEVLPDGSIKLMIYHREHLDAPTFARNVREGYSDGDLIDIPDGRFVSVRVKMPAIK